MVERSHTANWWPSVYEPIKRAGQQIADWFAPRSEAAALNEGYRISMELPGVKIEDIDISLQHGAMVVRGEKRFERKEEGENYYFSEREYGSFQRSFRLPADADTKTVDARLTDGVLTIVIAKAGAKPDEVHKIPIRQV